LDFLERLNALMERDGLNKSTLSERSGIPYTTIDGWYKKGYEGVKMSTLRKLAACFGVTIDDLVYGEEKNITRPQLSQRVTQLIEQNDQFRETVELLSRLDPRMVESVKQIAQEIIAKRDR